MKVFFYGLVFFVSFFRLSLISPGFYLSLIPAAFGLLLFLSRKKGWLLADKRFFPVVFFFSLILFYSFVADVFGGRGLHGDLGLSFAMRTISILFLSLLPAYFIYFNYFQGDVYRLKNIIVFSFVLQTFFWLVTYYSPDIKIFVYTLTGHADSVNLRDYNMSARGFGVSTEINYTSPFMMVFIALYYLRSNWLRGAVMLTQFVNSNLAFIPALIYFFTSRRNLIHKIVLFSIALVVLVLFAERYFPRVYGEFVAGQGLRTIRILLEDHVFLISRDAFHVLLGNGVSVFHGGHELRSDIGWVIMINYGGLVFVVLFLLFLAAFSYAIFGLKKMAFIWMALGIILNTKGLLLGPNAYFFFGFSLMLCNLRFLRNKRECYG